jgi:hypothetical protein
VGGNEGEKKNTIKTAHNNAEIPRQTEEKREKKKEHRTGGRVGARFL